MMERDPLFEEAVRQFCPHFVAIGALIAPLDAKGNFVDRLSNPDGSIQTLSDGMPAQKRAFCFSSFVMSFRDVWFLVTAGHILKDLAKLEGMGCQAIKKMDLLDWWGPDATFLGAVPFPLLSRGGRRFHSVAVYDDDEGVDYGAIYVPSLVRSNLEKNRIRPITEENWQRQSAVEFDDYFMIGLPTEWMEKTIGDSTAGERTGVRMQIAMLPLTKLPGPVGVFMEHRSPQFYAKLDVHESHLRNIDGMSGGPIVGVKVGKDNRVNYWVIAVQSEWLPESRVICACPIAPFGDVMSSFLDELIESVERDNRSL